MQRANEQRPIDTSSPIGEETELGLADRITAELVDDPDVVLMATCPANSAGHLATGIGGRVSKRISDWMVEHLYRTGDTVKYQQRVARWKSGSCNVQALTAAVANAIHAQHSEERRRRARTDAEA